MDTDSQWRFIIGIGALPCVISIILLEIESVYFGTDHPSPIITGAKLSLSITSRPTLTLNEEKSVGTDVSQDKEEQSRHTMSLRASQIMHELQFNHSLRRKIIGEGICWFMSNAFAFGIALLSGHIIAVIALNDDDNTTSNEDIRIISKYQMIVTTITICVAAMGVCLVSRLGLRNLLLIGFSWFTILTFLVTCLFDYLDSTNTNALFALYCLVYGFMNFGIIASAIYALSAALFPKEIRSTCGGICAAIGKLGAIFGAFMFAYLGESVSDGYTIVLAICTAMAAIGAISTYIFIHSHELYNNDEMIERESTVSFLSVNSSSNKQLEATHDEFTTYPTHSVSSRLSMTKNPLQQKLLPTSARDSGTGSSKHPQDLHL
jgi:hypothetical protein